MTEFGYGMTGSIQMSQQGSFGSAPNVASLNTIPIISETLVHHNADIVEDNMRGYYAESPSHKGPESIDGGISIRPYPTHLGWLLRAACGQSSSAIVASLATHKFLPLPTADAEFLAALPAQTILVDRVGQASASLYSDMVCGGMGFELANSELLRMSLDFMGGAFTERAPITPVFPAGVPWDWDQTSFSLGALSIAAVKSMTIAQNNNLTQGYWLNPGSRTPQYIKRTAGVQIEGSAVFTLRSDVHSYFQGLYLAKTQSQLLVNMAGPSNPPALRIDIPKLRIMEYNANISGPGEVEANLSFVGKFDETSNYLVEYTLTNTVPSYG